MHTWFDTPSPFATGWVHHRPGLWCPVFGRTYPLSVYTPPGYADGDRTHPVAYLFDGQNLYFDGGSHSGGWHLHDVLDQRANQGKVAPLVIGIHNGGESRLEELTPCDVWGRRGRGEAFLEWVTGPLAEHVRSEWRIADDAGRTMIGGSSLGGLMALYAFFRYPGRFGRVMAMSPSVFVAPEALTQRSFGPLPADRRIYVDAGVHELRLLERAEALVSHLVSQGFTLGRDLMWAPDPDGSHHESTWRHHLPAALQFLYD